jgi:hypothetical protein
MKKVALLIVIMVILAVSVMPVMAAGGNGHGRGRGHGNGNGGQGNTTQTQEQDKQQNGTNTGRGARGNAGMHTPFYLQGTILTIAPGTETENTLITVKVVHGNARVKQFIGVPEGMPIEVSSSALIFKIDQTGADESGESTATTTDENETLGNRVPIPVTDLNVGDMVAIHGNLVNEVVDNETNVTYLARLITVYVRVPETPPVVTSP